MRSLSLGQVASLATFYSKPSSAWCAQKPLSVTESIAAFGSREARLREQQDQMMALKAANAAILAIYNNMRLDDMGCALYHAKKGRYSRRTILLDQFKLYVRPLKHYESAVRRLDTMSGTTREVELTKLVIQAASAQLKTGKTLLQQKVKIFLEKTATLPFYTGDAFSDSPILCLTAFNEVTKHGF